MLEARELLSHCFRLVNEVVLCPCWDAVVGKEYSVDPVL